MTPDLVYEKSAAGSAQKYTRYRQTPSHISRWSYLLPAHDNLLDLCTNASSKGDNLLADMYRGAEKLVLQTKHVA